MDIEIGDIVKRINDNPIAGYRGKHFITTNVDSKRNSLKITTLNGKYLGGWRLSNFELVNKKIKTHDLWI